MIFSTEKKKGGSHKLDSTAVTALSNVTTASDVSDVLDILSALVARKHVVTSTSTGGATSVEN